MLLHNARTRALAGIVVASVGLAGCGSPGEASGGEGAQEQITLRMAGSVPEGHLLAGGEQYFIDRVEKITDGRVQIEYFPAGQLGGTTEMMGLLDSGAADIAFTAPGYLPSEMPLSGAFSLPRSYPDSKVGTTAYANVISDPESVIYQSDFAAHGLHPFFVAIYGDYQLMTTDVDFGSPEDFKGMSVRSAGGTTDLVVRALGAEPTPITTGDIYTAMDLGTVTGNIQSSSAAIGNSLHELVGYLSTNADLTAFPLAWTMNEERYKALPADVQEALDQAGGETTAHLGEVIVEENEKGFAVFEEQGAELIEFSPEGLAELEALLEPVQEQWLTDMSEQGLPGEEAMQEMQEAVSAIE